MTDNQLQNVAPYDGNLSGWWLLLQYLRFPWLPWLRRRQQVPRKKAIMDALSYISHMRQLAAGKKEGKILQGELKLLLLEVELEYVCNFFSCLFVCFFFFSLFCFFYCFCSLRLLSVLLKP